MMLFILGFVSGAIAVFTALLAIAKGRDGPAPNARQWTSIKNIEFRWHFDYRFTVPVTLRDIVHALPDLMRGMADKKPLPGGDTTTVAPGSYSVDMSVHARFVERPDDVV